MQYTLEIVHPPISMAKIFHACVCVEVTKLIWALVMSEKAGMRYFAARVGQFIPDSRMGRGEGGLYAYKCNALNGFSMQFTPPHSWADDLGALRTRFSATRCQGGVARA